MRPDTYTKNPDGSIAIGGISLQDLAREFGTPLYILDYASIVRRMQHYRDALQSMRPAGRAAYAGKAFLCRAMVEVVQQQGLMLDVVSGGELFTALKAGFPAEQIIFHGNVKTDEELELGLTAGVGQFVVDSLSELERLDRLARRFSRQAPVLLRITPGIDAHTHDFIRTGHFDSKFGFGLADDIADQAMELALASEHVTTNGFHAHIGSQILETDPFVANAEALLRFSRRWHERAGFWPRVLDIGGGIGVRYDETDTPPVLDVIVQRVERALEALTPPDLEPPQVIMEPGRSIVAEAGATLYTVEAEKTVAGGKMYVAVDGGMGDNIRPALYQARYGAEVDGKRDDAPDCVATLAGRYCESGDILIEGASLKRPQVGDLVAVWATGAYNYSMASTYNRVPRPAVVAVYEGTADLWVERETWEDVMRLDKPLKFAQRRVNA
ncbi:diaminopimelate decarboxylase [Sulfobacillus harzensis]|uniref:Diaminopimelate decarboxylase n=1 Tax=Sulfobacillus harzensis TaxID=2729629 RepID=A0A7Y0L356_9FIRM|nr:diaminopimelate decarboxylase [Sulfobacillus harzensis]NMP22433.1 diaminopimelate decarboxylase [Sulfobacillus harzensis]